MKSVTHFRDLEVWQLSMKLAKAIYKLTADFPSDQRYGLSAQMQRSAVSIPSNVAEGNARQTTRDYARFISMAAGSTAELQTQLLLAQALEVGDSAKLEHPLELCERIGQMLQRLRQALIKRLTPESRVPSPESR